MYCKFCGNKIDDDVIFCKYCGRQINVESLANQTNCNQAVSSVQNVQTEDTKAEIDEQSLALEENETICGCFGEVVNTLDTTFASESDLSHNYGKLLYDGLSRDEVENYIIQTANGCAIDNDGGSYRCPICNGLMRNTDDYYEVDGSDINFWKFILYFCFMGFIFRFIFGADFYEKSYTYKICPDCKGVLTTYKRLPIFGLILGGILGAFWEGVIWGLIYGYVTGKIMAYVYGALLYVFKDKNVFVSYQKASQSGALIPAETPASSNGDSHEV